MKYLIFISLYLCSWMATNHEKILDGSRIQDLSLTTRITLIAVMVCKLQKSQDDIVVLSRDLDQFRLLTV